MAIAPLPVPQYIDWETNVEPYIGTDKILVNDVDTTAIPTILANQLVAEGESLVLQDISPYYITVPTLLTSNNQDWTLLPSFTYTTLYYMFVIQASLKLIGNFIARNTDRQGTTLSYFQEFYNVEYAKYLNRITDTLPNGSYRYEMLGLIPSTHGIPRRPQKYVRIGKIGKYNYTDHQLTNPGINFVIGWPNYWNDNG